ncbi:MAG TPA: hypothetical protein PLM01_05285 [Bacteroidales bacterium]|jgi:hypothetical protein|nr:hypothetical protein [Bacteroidales bacterium]HQJ81905.1 hypothetical protein [Bacteroidales bacterium]
MKKPLLIVLLILAALLILPVLNLLQWAFMEKKAMNIIIVDKTVPSIHREKHKSFNWILTNNRFVNRETNRSFSFRKDYYGFIPTRPLKKKLWDRKEYRLADLKELPEKADAIYVTDTYGVFFNEWYQGFSQSRRTRKIYGGLNNNDNLLIKEMKDRNKLVVMEYNSFDFPTAEYESFRAQERLGIRFTGWTGKYFSSLDSASRGFPAWMPGMYRKQYHEPWSFTRPGIVLLQEHRIIVLEEGTHLTNPFPAIVTDDTYSSSWNLAGRVTFDQWFDIIDPMENDVISRFMISTTGPGDSLLAENSLANEFPAVIREPEERKTYYFSGDFASKDIKYCTSRFRNYEKLKGILYSKRADDPRRFFWLYYKPLIQGIFNEYYNTSGAGRK